MLPNRHPALPTRQRLIAFALSMALLAPAGVAAEKRASHGSGSSSSAPRVIRAPATRNHGHSPRAGAATGGHSTRPAGSHSGKASAAAPQHGAANHRGERCVSCERDSSGRILRSAEAKDAFKRQTGYPQGRPGYVIDHIVPLACGGADAPANMQWQTKEAAAAKDKTERIGCHR